jgi:GntR family transcriptional regulator
MSSGDRMSETAEGTVGFRPLYVQVGEELKRQLSRGRWQPGAMLPSEHELARELGVSQGTVRKALDAMTTERILVRRQGRGTFVAEFEESRILFQFFRLRPDEGDRLFPVSRILRRPSGPATSAEAAFLGLPEGTKLWRIARQRLHGSNLVMWETIAIPAARFEGFEEVEEIPNIYQLYSQRWGITITSASEQLRAVAASREDSEELGCPLGAPLLRIERVAYDIDKVPVEYRDTRALTDHMFYASDLT